MLFTYIKLLNLFGQFQPNGLLKSIGNSFFKNETAIFTGQVRMRDKSV